MKERTPPAPRHNSSFLPNFCDVRTVLVIVVGGELLAFVLTLAAPTGSGDWRYLSLASFFIQWVGLGSAALLCVLGHRLRGMSGTRSALIAYALVLGVTLVVSEAAYWMLRYMGEPGPGITGWRGRFMVRNLGISAIITAVVFRYLYVQHQWRVRIQSETQARVEALQARIRPHFLFNSMNVIASLTRSQPQRAESVVEDLADLFRASLADPSRPITIDEELEIVRRYLGIEELRLHERLALSWDMEAVPGDARVPALLLQPLLENAIYHGIEPRPEGGTVELNGVFDDGRIGISVRNPVARAGQMEAHRGNRMAMDNIRQRLDVFFDGAGALAVDDDGEHYQVTLSFPYLRDTP